MSWDIDVREKVYQRLANEIFFRILRIAEEVGEWQREDTRMKQPTFHGKVLLPLSVYEAARAGDILAMAYFLPCTEKQAIL